MGANFYHNEICNQNMNACKSLMISLFCRFQHRANTLVELGYAVLMINYRGSIGNGDFLLQSNLENIAKVLYENFILYHYSANLLFYNEDHYVKSSKILFHIS